jgi:hypothetical protein
MPTHDSSGLSEPCYGCGNPFEGNSPRWQAAISDFLDSDSPNPGGSRIKGRGYHWVSVCTPCFWLKKPGYRAGVRGPLLEGEIA